MLDQLDLEAVTMTDVPRRPHRAGGHDVDWAQGTRHVTLWTGLPAGTRAKQLDVRFTAGRLRVALRGSLAGGEDVLVEGALGNAVDPGECEWQLVNGELKVHLAKAKQREWMAPLLAREAGAAEPARTEPARAAAPPPRPRPLAPAEAAAAAARGRPADGYTSWDRFDQTAALMELENEGKTEDPTSFTLRAGGGAASMSAEGYKKDAEEVALDSELEEKRADLQVGLYTILPSPILYGVWHTKEGSVGGSILRNGRAIVLL